MPSREQLVSLIDHVYSNTIDNIIEVTVPVLGVSDHYPVCITRKLSKAFDTGPVHKFINYRNTKTFDEEQFLNDLNNQPWSVIDIFDDANDALDYFSDVFNSVLSTHAPKKQKRVKRQKQPKWINDEILTAMKIRDKFKETKNKTQYALWRNKVKLLIRNAKARLYSDSINTSSNPKDLWQTLHEMTGKSAHACTDFINDEDGSPILDPTVCANTFNSFFTSIHANFRTENNINSQKEHPDLTSIKNHVKMKLEKTSDFSIPLATESFILKQLQSLKTDEATGLDGLSAKYLKLSAQVIAKPLTAILNQSIQSSSYPNALKKAKVTPIFKKGSKADINNYRPISDLPIINSIFERHISNCLVDYLESNNLLYNHQSGFRIKCYLPVPTRKLFFNSYILPHMDYCCTVWGNINCRLTDSMVKFQKRAARIILDKSIETPSADMFAELNWMTFPDRVKFQKSVLIFKIFNNLTPSYLRIILL